MSQAELHPVWGVAYTPFEPTERREEFLALKTRLRQTLDMDAFAFVQDRARSYEQLEEMGRRVDGLMRFCKLLCSGQPGSRIIPLAALYDSMIEMVGSAAK